MAARPASGRRTFGNSRAEILAALANGIALAVVAIFISIHAVERFLDPTEVKGEGVMIVATGDSSSLDRPLHSRGRKKATPSIFAAPGSMS